LYTTLLMDADETLLDFCKSEAFALEATFLRYGLCYEPSVRERYHEINRVLWQQLERGEIARERLKVRRFEQLFEFCGITGVDAAGFNADYMRCLGTRGFMLPGALDLLQALSLRYEIYIITNGSASVQHTRLADSGMLPFVKQVFISEEIGADKPSPLFFDYVTDHVTCRDKKAMLVIGDSLTSDIRGGRLAGIDTCWYNPQGLSCDKKEMPTMQVASFEELRKILLPDE